MYTLIVPGKGAATKTGKPKGGKGTTMIINGKNYLLLERRGCEYLKDETPDTINNYRVCTAEKIQGNDGIMYFVEFTKWDRWIYRTTNKRTGAPLKKGVTEIVQRHALHIDTEYENENGSWKNSRLEQALNNRGYDYSENDILAAVNSISAVKYDGIKYVEAFTVTEHGNFTPASVIYKWAKAHRLEQIGNNVKMYTGIYKYMAYNIDNSSADNNLTIYLERVA